MARLRLLLLLVALVAGATAAADTTASPNLVELSAEAEAEAALEARVHAAITDFESRTGGLRAEMTGELEPLKSRVPHPQENQSSARHGWKAMWDFFKTSHSVPDVFPSIDLGAWFQKFKTSVSGMSQVPLPKRCEHSGDNDRLCSGGRMVNLAVAVSRIGSGGASLLERMAAPVEVPPVLRGVPKEGNVYVVSKPWWEFLYKQIYIRHNAAARRWEWSMDKRAWMSTYNQVVTHGQFKDTVVQSTDAIDLINAINYFENADEARTLPRNLGGTITGPVDGIFTIEGSLFVTDIFLRKSHAKWTWSPDKIVWMHVSELKVSHGFYKGLKPVEKMVAIIDKLWISEGGDPSKRLEGSFTNAVDALYAIKDCIVEQYESNAVPQLFIQGFTGNLFAGVGGVESVWDFEKNQVGRFAYGGVSIGTASLSIGGALYTGVGWKGRSRGMDIADAYSGWFNSVDGSVSIPIPGVAVVSASIGGLLAFSSDAKLTHFVADSPVCNDVVTACMSLGIGAGPGKFGFDVSSTKYLTNPNLNTDCSRVSNPRACMAFWLLVTPSLPFTDVVGWALLGLHSL